MPGSFLNNRVIVKVGDITEEVVDAIVNAANSTLLGGGGVDGAIHRRGGPEILAACREIRRTSHSDGLPTGEAVITTGGQLPARHVIHTVGPIYGHDHPAAELLAACYENSLALASEHGLTTIAFPAISTGVYGYPKAQSAEISSRTIADFLAVNTLIIEVRLVFHTSSDAAIFLSHHVF
ncbi:MAG TPA: O-acetyl-ADP-ribose deacetylase [Pyrinomonadaceae bacterium]|nr:O-acetyl-ADP-ribose deacetylase [Pyrinomonadaceae bacterium]